MNRYANRLAAAALLMVFVLLAAGCTNMLLEVETTDSAFVNEDTFNLSLGYAQGDYEGGVTRDISLPTSVNGTSITWESDRPDVIDPSGTVQRPGHDQQPVEVTLTARLAFGSANSTRTFSLTVQPAGAVNVIFDTDGGEAVQSHTVDEGSLIQEPTAPTKHGYLFGGWYADEQRTTAWDFAGDRAEAENNKEQPYVTLYAKWDTYAYTVSFDGRGAETDAVPDSLIVASPATTLAEKANEKGSQFGLPAEPVQDGHHFVGWHTEPEGAGQQFTADTPVTDDVTVYAHWSAIPVFTVTFETAGGSSIAEQSILQNETAVEPGDNPTRTGFHFSGWFADSSRTTQWNFATPITAGTTIYAGWEVHLTFSGLLRSAGGQASLYIEWAAIDFSNLNNRTLSRAEPETGNSPNTEFSHTIVADESLTYYYRAVAINELGRVEGDLYRAAFNETTQRFEAVHHATAGSPPVGSGGTFRISDYGTGELSGNHYYRGYLFEVSAETTVTHLIGGGTSGTFTVVLYEAEQDDASTGETGSSDNNPRINGTSLLGHADITDQGAEHVTPITPESGGGSTVALVPGQLYLLAQGRSEGSGSHYYVNDLQIADLETHARIKTGTWQPRENRSIRWSGTGDQNFILGQDRHLDYDGAMPRIGFLFESTVAEYPDVDTDGNPIHQSESR